MPTIKVPRSFYVKERTQVYSEWHEAFWRELIQNSVDAGSTIISVYARESEAMYSPENPWQPGVFEKARPMLLVTFQDNGPGMTKKVLEDVYMTLGASQKGAGAAGGFGRARILTCFSHPSWMLASQDWQAQSTDEGTGYELVKSRVKQEGLLVQVQLEADMDQMTTALVNVVNECQLDGVKILFNDEDMSTRSDFAPINRGEKLKTLIEDQATLFSASGGDCINYLLVRVNGLIMFKQYLYASKDAKGYVLELEPSTSRSLLSASRDSAKAPLSTKLDELVAELNRGNTDAAHDRVAEPKLIRFGDGGPRSYRIGVGSNYTLPEYRAWRQRRAQNTASASGKRPALSKTASGAIIRNLFNNRKEERTVVIQQAIKKQDPLTIYLEGGAVYLKVDANQQKWIDGADLWSPNSWKAVLTDKNAVGWFPKFKPMAEQLKAWALACEACSAVLTLITGSSFFFYPGIIVSPNVRGAQMHLTNQDGNNVSILMFNPLFEDFDGKIINFFDLRTNDGLRELVSVAMHETVHLAQGQHNETYAKILTEMISLLNIEELMTVIRNRL